MGTRFILTYVQAKLYYSIAEPSGELLWSIVPELSQNPDGPCNTR